MITPGQSKFYYKNWHRVAYQTRDASCKRRVCIPTGGEVSQRYWTGTKRRPLTGNLPPWAWR